ncbi:reverse transcriptase domain-containing protein [Thiohalorhabdus sp.]
MVARGLSPHPERRGSGDRRANGGCLRGRFGGQSDRLAGAAGIRPLPGPADPKGADPEGRWPEPGHRYPDGGGQGCPASGGDGPGPLYEQNFRSCSHGVGPGRNPHQALDSMPGHMVGMKGGWVVEIDIRAFFDEMDRDVIREVLDGRVRDGVLRRLIDKWLKAGVVEDGQLGRPTRGTPQEGILSPLLANIYLDAALDRWFEDQVKPRLHDRGELTRFADDAVMVFATERDARRVMDVLPQRMAPFGLRLHPEKTRLLSFHPPGRGKGPQRGSRSFDFLGFTHFWARSRQGRWVVKQKTASDRWQRSLDAIQAYCRANRHRPLAEQHRALSRMLKGHYAYFGRVGNHDALNRLRTYAQRAWVKWLERRSQRGGMPWKKAMAILACLPLPRARTAWSTTT